MFPLFPWNFSEAFQPFLVLDMRPNKKELRTKVSAGPLALPDRHVVTEEESKGDGGLEQGPADCLRIGGQTVLAQQSESSILSSLYTVRARRPLRRAESLCDEIGGRAPRAEASRWKMSSIVSMGAIVVLVIATSTGDQRE